MKPNCYAMEYLLPRAARGAARAVCGQSMDALILRVAVLVVAAWGARVRRKLSVLAFATKNVLFDYEKYICGLNAK